MSPVLCFNEIQFDVIPQNSQPWVRGIQIGYALEYQNPAQAISKLYDSHADEFTDAMTAVVTLPTEGGPQETRIFSLRGCHLLAMFARTPVAKAFRRWVLDVIEQYGDRVPVAQPVTPDASPISRRSDPERKALTAIINTWVSMAPIHYAAARAQVNAHFGVAGVDRLTVAQVKEAIQWVQAKIDALPAAPQLSSPAPDMPPLPTEKDLLDFAREVEEGQRQIRKIFTTLHHKLCALEEPLFRRAASRAFGRAEGALRDGGEPVTLQWSFLMMDKLMDALSPTTDHVRAWDNPALCLLEYRAGQM